jgi:tagatose-6-phosphate ketose/aldose isomerase
MSFLGITENELEHLGGIHTAREIYGQPELWFKTWQAVENQRIPLHNFLNPLLAKPNLEIILTGAGSSAFIGEVLQGPLHKATGRCTRAVPTTDLVSHPELYLPTSSPVLLISFARSGNSPESIAAVRWANLLSNEVYHLIITCNPQGILARETSTNKSYVFFLPPEADDQSLAMTGSFSSMLLCGLLISRLNHVPNLKEQIELLAEYGRTILNKYLPQLQRVAQLNYKRVVFLGSGPMQGIARESHLKLQELTDGGIVCKHDSYLGFRHGPRAVVNQDTLLVFLFSNDQYVAQYEQDLVRAINNGEKGLYRLGIMEKDVTGLKLDLKLILSARNNGLIEEFLAICCVLPAQIIGFFKSLQLGLKPDNPSASGAITRVVQGVQIYPFEKARL